MGNLPPLPPPRNQAELLAQIRELERRRRLSQMMLFAIIVVAFGGALVIGALVVLAR
jgi:hypothetical protein